MVNEKYELQYLQLLGTLGGDICQPLTKEKIHIKEWVEEYNFSTELIYEAYVRTIKKLGRLEFSYADGILKN